MEASLRAGLLLQTKQAQAANDWDAVVRIWQPYIQQGQAEAEFQLAYHYFWFAPADDDQLSQQMDALLESAASKDHGDAIWFSAMQRWQMSSGYEMVPAYEQMLLRAGNLGSVHAQRALGVAYATGEWTGPKDLAQAIGWYRLAARNGCEESKYDLGFMLLLGQGEPKNTQEGLYWLELAGEAEDYLALILLADCFTHGYYGVSADAAKATLWRKRKEEHDRRFPPQHRCRFIVEGALLQASLKPLWDVAGIDAVFAEQETNQFEVFYNPTLLSPMELVDRVNSLAINAKPLSQKES